MRSKLTTIILIGMVLGILGRLCVPHPLARSEDREEHRRLHFAAHRHLSAPDQDDHRAARVLDPGRGRRAYGRHQSGRAASARKAMTWFVAASLVSLLLGMVLVNVLRPGDNLNLPLPDAQAATNLKVTSLSMKEFVAHLVPRSIVEAMATNEILQIVVFSLFFGVACAALGERARKLVEGIEELSHVILTITGYIMELAPIAVFAAMAAIVTTQGLGHPRDLRQVRARILFRARAAVVPAGRASASSSSGRTASGWSIWCASRSCSRSPPRAARRRTRRPWSSSRSFRSARRSSASCCRWAIRSISTAR